MHDLLRAHNPARGRRSVQDGVTTRLRILLAVRVRADTTAEGDLRFDFQQITNQGFINRGGNVEHGAGTISRKRLAEARMFVFGE